MKQEDKDLLLKDLCARLPYGVKMNHIADDEHSPKTLIGIAKDMITLSSSAGYSCVDMEHYKPYLFPLSSMTEEQNDSWRDAFMNDLAMSASINYPESEKYLVLSHVKSMQWLYENHFDVNGLIDKGLAIDATGLNIY